MQTLTSEQLHDFEKLDSATLALAVEFDTLRGADAAGQAHAVSETKQHVIVAVLTKGTEFLGDEAPYVDIGEMDMTKLTFGDVTVLLTQWRAALASYQSRRTDKRYGKRFWRVRDDDGEIRYVPVGGQAAGDDAPDEG